LPAIIGTAELTANSVEKSELTAGTVNGQPPVYRSSVALVANTSNWRAVARNLIGDEPVTYEERSKKDTLRKFPIIDIFSEDKEALNRVLTKAAEVE
jgi:hypothetical protein